MPLENIQPVDVHKEPLYFGKPLSLLVDLELIQAYEYCCQAEEKREAAKSHPKFNNPKKPLILPPINPNYQILKDAILAEMEKRNLQC